MTIRPMHCILGDISISSTHNQGSSSKAIRHSTMTTRGTEDRQRTASNSFRITARPRPSIRTNTLINTRTRTRLIHNRTTRHSRRMDRTGICTLCQRRATGSAAAPVRENMTISTRRPDSRSTHLFIDCFAFAGRWDRVRKEGELFSFISRLLLLHNTCFRFSFGSCRYSPCLTVRNSIRQVESLR